YGMSTFEGPMLSIKSLNAISHYTDWTIAHVHIGALGWNGFLTFGMLYFLIPKMFNVRLHSIRLANTHFWLGTLGILFYAIPLYWAAITQWAMWRQFSPDGFLVYPNFLETVTQILPMYGLRAIGGALYLSGVFVMIYNIYKTVKVGTFVKNEAAEAPALEAAYKDHGKEHWHRPLERKPMLLLVISLVVILIGGIVEMVPTFLVKSNVPTIASVQPYTPLELHGRDVYISEGCNNCHSQMVRPFRHETERYGEYSKSGEFVYDHPFLWGSKRTGPDLHRVGGKYSDSWHYNHMIEPESMSQGSIMPRYVWMATTPIDTSTTVAKINAMRTLGVPYEEGYEHLANADVRKQQDEIVQSLASDGITAEPNTELIALISYLQRLGTDIALDNKTAEND
ncbi:MAG: cytochrome-c oxidase, cbb3-type subunit II, partial [Cryomorphaceae bacterium]